MKIEKMTLEDLVAAEQAASAVRKNYEDKMYMFRGANPDYFTLSESEQKEYEELSKKLSQVNGVRFKIFDEMEKRLLNIETDD